jgi:hypothetical protein
MRIRIARNPDWLVGQIEGENAIRRYVWVSYGFASNPPYTDLPLPPLSGCYHAQHECPQTDHPLCRRE